jgi:Zn-dependent hydrolases, including glyoxylases
MQGSRTFSLVFAGLFLSSFASAQNFDNVQITATPVAGTVQMLQGQGGNIAVSIGADGVLMVDDQFGPLADKIKAKITELGGGAPAFLLNTHWHGDHTGGNEFFSDAATIIAHDNVRVRLADPSAERVPAALPVITYSDGISVHYNGEEIRLIHLPNGHTDGDSAVWFIGSNVVHMGDEYVNRTFPFIDTASGGTLEGLMQNSQRMLELLPDDVKIIPGHGALSTKAEFAEWAEGVKTTVALVLEQKAAGKDLQTIIDEGLPAEYESWGQGFINESAWITAIYNSGLSRE